VNNNQCDFGGIMSCGTAAISYTYEKRDKLGPWNATRNKNGLKSQQLESLIHKQHTSQWYIIKAVV